MKCKYRTAFDSSRHLGSALRRSKGKPGAAGREGVHPCGPHHSPAFPEQTLKQQHWPITSSRKRLFPWKKEKDTKQRLLFFIFVSSFLILFFSNIQHGYIKALLEMLTSNHFKQHKRTGLIYTLTQTK